MQQINFKEAYELMEAAESHKRRLGRLYDKCSSITKPLIKDRYNTTEDAIVKLSEVVPRKSKEYKL